MIHENIHFERKMCSLLLKNRCLRLLPTSSTTLKFRGVGCRLNHEMAFRNAVVLQKALHRILEQAFIPVRLPSKNLKVFNAAQCN
jgi:hypothetical protein